MAYLKGPVIAWLRGLLHFHDNFLFKYEIGFF